MGIFPQKNYNVHVCENHKNVHHFVQTMKRKIIEKEEEEEWNRSEKHCDIFPKDWQKAAKQMVKYLNTKQIHIDKVNSIDMAFVLANGSCVCLCNAFQKFKSKWQQQLNILQYFIRSFNSGFFPLNISIYKDIEILSTVSNR